MELAKQFSLGAVVEWESQAAGVIKKKAGKIIEVVPPGEMPKASVRHTDNARSFETYVVRVEVEGGRRSVNYWPRPMNLKPSTKAIPAAAVMPQNDMFWLMHRTAGSSLVDKAFSEESLRIDGFGLSDRSLICRLAMVFFDLSGFSESDREQIGLWAGLSEGEDSSKSAIQGMVDQRLRQYLREKK